MGQPRSWDRLIVALSPLAGPRLWLLGALVLAAIGGGVLAGWYLSVRTTPSGKPQSPFLNTRPGVKYVGDDRCADCHVEQATTYRAHPMGRSVGLATKPLPGQREAPRTFTVGEFLYSVEAGKDRVVHREAALGPKGEVLTEQAEEIAFAVGSGRQGQSFLLQRSGAVFLSPISWYSGKKAWDLSPEFQNLNQHFNRIIPEGCLFCHSDGARAEPGSVNLYAQLRLQPIGCERCHGPGELHVAARSAEEVHSGPDRTIVNPMNLEPALREAVCQQCHLQGESRLERRGKSLNDYRPGLPLEEFVAVFVSAPEASGHRKAVSQVEQIAQSQCFRGSGEKLGCVSCHDPHVLPSERERVAFYRGRCLACHADQGCTMAEADRRRQSHGDSCVECHMPRLSASNIAHAAITDHRVVRRPSPEGAAASARGRDLLTEFHRSGEGQGGRERGLMLAEVAEWPLSIGERRQVAAEGRQLLESAVRSDPDDVRAWEGLGLARWLVGNPRGGLAALEEALHRSPREERALESAGRVALALKDLKRSEEYWRRMVEVNPSRWHAHASLAQVQALQGLYTEALDGCRQSLALNPLEHQTRLLLVNCLLGAGQLAKARAELEIVQKLRPAERDKLEKWFDEEAAATEGKRR
jgi:Tetratricopeptide repeat/Cytochrome c554 and c-prime